MALISCPECGRQISDKSVACPNCGLPSDYYVLKTGDSAEGTGDNVAGNGNSGSYNYGTNNNFATYNSARNSSVSNNSARINSARINSASNNGEGINVKLDELREYFDHIMDEIDPGIRLDEEQRRAVLTDDVHCLLVAGAGAGKTTTMTAKVKYLVDKKGINPQDIIVISYTNKAINELKERINKHLKIPARVCTFHSFAFDIVKRAKDEPPEINFSSYNIIYDMLAQKIFDDRQLTKNLVMFMGYYFDLPEEFFDFRTLNEYHLYKTAMNYETLKSGLGEYVNTVANKRTRSVRTITGEFLRSMQEVQIANFLYLNGIDYIYEKPYPYQMREGRKIYNPDFYISQGENDAYIEHYGITQNMKSYIFTPAQIATYQKNISDKRALHKRHNTKLIETWSFYIDRKPLLEHLKAVLVENGFILQERDLDEVYNKIADTGKDKYIYKLVWFTMNFIEQYKTAGYDERGFDILRKRTDNVRNLLYLDIVEQVYLHYQQTLKGKNQIDFADMINDANSLLSEMERQGTTLPYKYVIIDEFQDIARQRFNLTKKLADITGAKVVAVGDDWQSIFAFAGSDITLFTRFVELMGSGIELKITHTYRNSQELIDIAGSFIQKNSMQIRKRLISPKMLSNPVKLEFYNDNFQMYKNLAATVNNIIGKIITEFGDKKSILLIGRYGFDMDNLIRGGGFVETGPAGIKAGAAGGASGAATSSGGGGYLRSTVHPGAKLTFMTAHSSKGLGYDNVIILNMLESRYGFPSQIEDDPIIKMVTCEDKSIPFAEERRLFYVALTRTKNRVYIASPIYRPSRFLLELIADYQLPCPKEVKLDLVDIFRLRCPECGFPLKYENNKNYGLGLYCCTNESEICDFMTNDRSELKDIFRCPKCHDGYMIIKRNKQTGEAFYGCTNFAKSGIICDNAIPLPAKPTFTGNL